MRRQGIFCLIATIRQEMISLFPGWQHPSEVAHWPGKRKKRRKLVKLVVFYPIM
jgi:hypothetical protein